MRVGGFAAYATAASTLPEALLYDQLASVPADACQACRAELRATQERQTKMHRFRLHPDRYLSDLEARWRSRRDAAITAAVFPRCSPSRQIRPCCRCSRSGGSANGRGRGASLTIAVDHPAKAQHRRFERRILWALADPAQNIQIGAPTPAGRPCSVGQPWPHVQQVCRIERRRIRQRTGETETEVTHAITSLPAEQADAEDLLALARGHWGIENKIHDVREYVC